MTEVTSLLRMIMKTLNLSLKLYSTFHTDLLALKECDVAFTALVKLALYYRVRDRKLNIFVPECREYRYTYRHAYTKEVIPIDDEVTILFLTTMIREKRRMAFVRSVLYEALISPPCGEYFKDCRLISLESERLGGIDLSGYNDVLICKPGNGTKRCRPRLLRPTVDIPEWVPREWFYDPVSDIDTGIASPPGHGNEKREPSLVDDTTAGQQERMRRKKKRKRKKKKAHESVPSALSQDSINSCKEGLGAFNNKSSETENADLPSSGAPEEEFPMLEEEDY